jgi:hypothetical protein
MGTEPLPTIEETMQAFDEAFGHLSADDQKVIRKQIAAQLADPSSKTTDNIWYIIIGTLAAIAVAALIGVVVLVFKDKSATVVASFGTLAIGGLIGIVAPSPTQSGG